VSTAIALAAVLIALAVFSVLRYPFLHPLQLWSVPWALATGLFALHLLPYRALELETAALIAAATAAFSVGMLATTNAARLDPARGEGRSSVNAKTVERAAMLAVGLTFAGLAVYLVQLTQRFGLHDVFVTSPEVRSALSDGAAALTIKYLYVGYAACALCGIAAGSARDARRRHLWLGLGILTVLAEYFTTARSNVILTALVLVLAEAVVRRRELGARGLIVCAVAVAALALLVFSAGGAIIGKTLDNNPELGAVSSPLTEKRLLRPLALPYQYASAPIAALQVQVHAARQTEDALGCATFAVACTVAAHLGADVTPEPAIRPFTRSPLAWNTYTALDLPLVDGGPLFAIAFFALAGAWLGWLWRRARAGSTRATAVYAVYGTVVLYSAVQNNYFAPQIVGATGLILAFIWIGAHARRGRSPAAEGRSPGDRLRAPPPAEREDPGRSSPA
jgi:hypothetical protein